MFFSWYSTILQNQFSAIHGVHQYFIVKFSDLCRSKPDFLMNIACQTSSLFTRKIFQVFSKNKCFWRYWSKILNCTRFFWLISSFSGEWAPFNIALILRPANFNFYMEKRVLTSHYHLWKMNIWWVCWSHHQTIWKFSACRQKFQIIY